MPDEQGGFESSEGRPTVLAATDRALPIAVRPIEDERTPEEMICLGTYLGERLIARCVVPADTAGFLEEHRLFAEPVRLALSAREESPGLQCQLFALVTLPQDGEAEAEPWAASVPGADYEQSVREEEEQEQSAAVLLGQIVRFDRDRRHPENLSLEAVDILTKIVAGEVVEVVDKLLEDLLDDPPESA